MSSPESQVCYPEAEHAASCPITEIKFVTKAQAETTYSPETDWTVIDFNDQYSLVYSKQSDSLPVTKTAMEKEPCLDPASTSLSANQFFFDAEVASLSGECPDLPNFHGIKYDSRFKKAGF